MNARELFEKYDADEIEQMLEHGQLNEQIECMRAHGRTDAQIGEQLAKRWSDERMNAAIAGRAAVKVYDELDGLKRSFNTGSRLNPSVTAEQEAKVAELEAKLAALNLQAEVGVKDSREIRKLAGAVGQANPTNGLDDMVGPSRAAASPQQPRLDDLAIGPTFSGVVQRPACLVSSFDKRVDMPDGTVLVKMSPRVVDSLATLGLCEPVPFSLLHGKWWIANVDASVDNPNFEAGGCTTEVAGTTEQLLGRYWSVYCEVTRGPFNNRDEIDGSCFATDGFNRRRLGDSVRILPIPTWVARRLAELGMPEPVPISALPFRWWVCGMGGGVCSTEDLAKMLDFGWHITDGPFDSKNDAEYSFDVLWESPE